MELVFLWPGKTRNQHLRTLQEEYLAKLKPLIPTKIIETPGARGLDEKLKKVIIEKETQGLEKYLKDGYIICLSDKGKEIDSDGLARMIEDKALFSGKKIIFVVGGFLGLSPGVLEKAHLEISLSRMTFSHELARVVLLEQVYRAMNIIKGYAYPK